MRRIFGGLTLAACICAAAGAQGVGERPASVADYAKPIAYPHADEAQVRLHFNRARAIAKDDLYVYFDTLCIQDQIYKERTNNAQYLGLIPAQRVFDELYYVGQMMVGAWALKTRDGIILFDALNNKDEAREIVVAGLHQMGLRPEDVKYVVITHGHGDHYGGARYFRDTYGSRLVASAEDWAFMAKPSRISAIRLFDPAPQPGPGDIVVKDGDTLKLGEAVVRFALTPGHTPGTLSSMFDVHDNGVRHVAGFYGGIGLPAAADARHQQIASLTRWMDITRIARVDAQIGNHPLHFDGPARLEVLKYRAAGAPNPFVIGGPVYQRYIALQRECVKLALARAGEATP
ncbi:MBL fold metallo-hydrolase [Sphingomonas nostoxanthinifaciens]|uniref:MBL fold metallo-hydrolase n=1 Tax=Sphingomonas nostoxanthinifaciens TaxID=2872652 RepID=UPI001CC1E1D3|nr:MBL fold metallo-hydrolase [Sphingomonas nostoxanthinifaciens]UAK23283.1 MBL fold metallo-hydrolase [Sphingomonas nostoxanthinifaciens]